MITEIIADCWDAKYDEEIETLLIFCYLRDMGVKRVLPIRRADVVFKGNPEVPHEEMHKTANLWKGKPFKLQMHDDVDPEKGPGLFMKEKVMINNIGSQMMEIADKMSTDEWIMKFKTEDLFRRNI